ncbi:MAG: hypothetical protein ABI743_11435, partial [bacterium]
MTLHTSHPISVWCLALTTVALVVGCTGSTPTTPGLTATTGGHDFSAVHTRFGEGEQITALFNLQVDPVTMATTVTPIRAATHSDQAATYDLDISFFSKPDTFLIESTEDLGSTVRITYTHAHPFPAPNWANPPTWQNRCDLGYTGRMVFLTDVAQPFMARSTFFGDSIVDVTSVPDADGYVRCRALLPATGFLANVFPYKLLVDEDLDNRVGVRSYTPHGNYDLIRGGWQQHNIGTARIGWTGYDFLHAGQVARNSAVLTKAALAAMGGEVQVALVIKYTNPKGVPGKSQRLPPFEFDNLKFAYRVEHAALDCSKITCAHDFDLGSGRTSQVTVPITVRDWDDKAPEEPNPDLSESASLIKVVPGAAGRPKVQVTVPLLINGIWSMGGPTGSGPDLEG